MRKKLEPGLLKLAVMAICLVAAILTNSCARKPAKSQIDANAYTQELSQWQRKRWADLKGETGWLTLVGPFWLKKNVVRLDASQTGFTVDGKPIKSLELKTDDDDKPTIVHFDSMTFQI